jgi:hypothetical protein
MSLALQTREVRARSRSTAADTRLAGTGGLLVAAGAVAYVVHIVARSMLTAGVDPVESARGALWVPVNALGAVAAMAVLLGMPVIAARLRGQVGIPPRTGLALIEVSWMFFGVFLSLYGALVLPWLAGEVPHLVDGSAAPPTGVAVAFALGLLAWLLGALLLAVPFVKGPARPRWVGYVLPASALWTLAGSAVIAPDGPADNLALNLLSNLGPVLLLVAVGYLGFRMWTERTPRRG